MSADVLLVTADVGLLRAIPRLCALAGVQCETERDSERARAAWRSAAAVLVGFDVARALAAAGMPRRDRVVVLTDDTDAVGCWQAAVALGATAVLRLPDQEAALVEELRLGAGSAGTAGVLTVVGGCGGAGASTLAAALAITAAASGKALLVDGDPLGGGLDVLIGAESVPGLRWNELATTRGLLDPGAFAGAICDVHGIGLLSWGRAGAICGVDIEVADAVLSAARRAFTTVVVDLPRCGGPLADRLLEAADMTLVVVPAEVRAVAATATLVRVLGRRLANPQIVVRDPGGGRLAARDVAASLGIPVLATMRTDASVPAAAQRGEPPIRRGRCALTQTCEAILAAVLSAAAA